MNVPLMRLSEIKKIILDNISALELKHTQQNNGHTTVQNLPQAIDAVENLKQLSFLESSINKLQVYKNIYTTRTTSASIPTNEFEPFRIAHQEFYNQCLTILSLAEFAAPHQIENMVCIKLLETANISDVKNLVINLDDAFSQISNLTNYKGSVRFAGFESGTDWINLIVDGKEYIVLIYLLIKTGYSIAQDYINFKLLNQRYSAALIQNQVDKDLKDVVKAMSSEVVKKLIGSENLDIVPDEIERLVHATAKIATIIVDGNKVVASLTAPPEKQSQLLSCVKQITAPLEELKRLASPENSSNQISEPEEPTTPNTTD